jgi:RNA polymerase sigma factor (sigma-70 family)
MKYLKDYDSSKDASMQVFENLIEGLKKHEVNNFKSWLHSVTKNYCLMQLRSTKTVSMDVEIEKNVTPLMEYGSFLHQENEISLESKLNGLEKAIQELKEEQRTCVELFYLKEKCYNEITEITGYSLNQVKSHIQNGKRNLQLLLSKINEPSR